MKNDKTYFLAIDNFEQLTSFPLKKYLLETENFFKFSYPIIVDYFSGVISKVEQIHIKTLFRLIKDAQTLSIQFGLNRTKLTTVDYWELYDFCEDLRTKLQTTTKISKYLRSSRTNFDYDNSFNFPFTMGQQQTLENISNDLLQDENPLDDWANTALKNDLLETDYGIDGGKALTLFKEVFIGGFVLSVVDNMIGEKVYGLDLDRTITFLDDDLKVLTYKNTVFQCADILAHLKEGDVPEFMSMGIPKSLFIGGNLQSFSIPGIISALNKNFATDDLFRDFVVTDISYKDGDYRMEYTVGTKYELLVESTAVI
jgi:hypothetical protein